MGKQEPKSEDPIAAQADRLEKALADLEARRRVAAGLAVENAPQFERLKALQARLDALPQHERREVLDAIGQTSVYAAPKPIEPIRGRRFGDAPPLQKKAPRWALWLSIPSVELWQAVLLSLGIEPDEAFKAEACATEPTGNLLSRRLPREFFARRKDCFLALRTQGPIRPQGPLYDGMLRDPRCSVLLAEVAAFLGTIPYEVPQEMQPHSSASRGPLIKRSALKDKYEQAWRTVDRDLRDASENGLSDAAKADEHGMWFETAALEWAQKNGKYTPLDRTTKRKATPFDGLER